MKANTQKAGVSALLDEVADYIEIRVPAYRWPGKTTYAFSLTEHTEHGRPSLRVYLNVSLLYNKRGVINLVFQERADKALGEQIDALLAAFPGTSKRNKYNQIELQINAKSWPEVRSRLDALLADMVDAWKKKTAEEDQADS